MCFSATLSVRPTCSSLNCVHKSILYVCIFIPALQIRSSVTFFYIPLFLFSRSVVSNSATTWTAATPGFLVLERSQASSGACSNSCPLNQWCHPTILSSVVPFSSYLQSFPASGSFPVSWFFSSGGQSTGASASASVLLVKFRIDFL